MKNKNMPTLSQALKINFKAWRILFKEYPHILFSNVLVSIWSALSPYVGIFLAARVIDELSSGKDSKTVIWLVAVTLVAEAVIALLTALLKKYKETQSAGLYYKVENIYTKKLLNTDFATVDDPATQELLTTIRQNRNGGGWGIYRMLYDVELLVGALFSTVGGISLTVTLFTQSVPQSAGDFTVLNNPLFLIAIIVAMVIITCAAPLLDSKAQGYYAKLAGTLNLGNRLHSHFLYVCADKRYAEDTRVYRQYVYCEKYGNDKTSTFGTKGVFSKYSKGPVGILCALSAAISVVFTLIVYVFVCLKAWAGAFGIGALTQYISAFTKLSDSFSNILRTFGAMKNNAPFLRLELDFLELPDKLKSGEECIEKVADDEYRVEFVNVSFKYPGTDMYALKNVNIKFGNGRRLAVVGKNGSGKTTFIKLLCRLYDPTEGTILLNGKDIKEYDIKEYGRVFSVVFQDFALFAMPLGENVATSAVYDRNKAVRCLEEAGFGERLKSWEDGLDTMLYKVLSEKGVEISGGEAQKIALARALYKDAPVVVLDEPTAALDPIAESEIYENFNKIVKNKTAIYISHRLSSCRFCDDIAVFEGGQVVQQGTHEELLEDTDGQYSELWNAQAQYYNERNS